MGQSASQSGSAPQLPLVVLTKVASMLPKDETGYHFRNRLQLAAVSCQLRQAVLSCIQQQKRQYMLIVTDKDYFWINGVALKKDEDENDGLSLDDVQLASVTRRLLRSIQQNIRRMMPARDNQDRNSVNVNGQHRSSYPHAECIDALLAFAQPNSLHLIFGLPFLNQNQIVILKHSLPLCLTSVDLELRVKEIGVDSPLDQTLKVVANKTNLETLKVNVECFDESAKATYLKSSPSVPNDSPFNHLLTLKNLRTLHVNAHGLLSGAQLADLVNRSQSKITHICCRYYNRRQRDEQFRAMSGVVRDNITSICCVQLTSFEADHLRFIDLVSNCAAIHFEVSPFINYFDELNLFDELGDWLLDVCRADDVSGGRTVECSVGCYNNLQESLEEGGQTQMEYTRDDTVVRLFTGSEMAMKKHCPFNNSIRDFCD